MNRVFGSYAQQPNTSSADILLRSLFYINDLDFVAKWVTAHRGASLEVHRIELPGQDPLITSAKHSPRWCFLLSPWLMLSPGLKVDAENKSQYFLHDGATAVAMNSNSHLQFLCPNDTRVGFTAARKGADGISVFEMRSHSTRRSVEQCFQTERTHRSPEQDNDNTVAGRV